MTFALLAYNQEDYIREAVQGTFAQAYKSLEITLSDDCSSNRTYQIMQEMAGAYRGPDQDSSFRRATTWQHDQGEAPSRSNPPAYDCNRAWEHKMLDSAARSEKTDVNLQATWGMLANFHSIKRKWVI